jgi:hypothetical protein
MKRASTTGFIVGARTTRPEVRRRISVILCVNYFSWFIPYDRSLDYIPWAAWHAAVLRTVFTAAG